MVKESLYCVTSKRKINQKKAFVYHCERDTNDPIQNDAVQSPKQCNVCKKPFKDDRCLKIHKTKMKHWNAPVVSSSSKSNANMSSRSSSSASSSSSSSSSSSASSSSSSSSSSSARPVQPQQYQRPPKRKTSHDISAKRNKR